MRKSILFAALLVLLGMSLPLKAQDTSRGNIYIGYDYLSVGVSQTAFGQPSGFDVFSFNGGSIQAAFNAKSYLAFVGDFGGYVSPKNSGFGTPTQGLVSYMGGPRLMLSRGRIQPFLQVLLGASTLLPRIADSNGHFINSGSDTEFSMTAGGGVDITLTRRIAIRPGQIEYYLTRFQDCTLGSASACTNITRSQNNFRYSGGVVIRLGGK